MARRARFSEALTLLMASELVLACGGATGRAPAAAVVDGPLDGSALPAPAARWGGSCAVLPPEAYAERSEDGCSVWRFIREGGDEPQAAASTDPTSPPFDRDVLLTSICAHACAPREAEVELLAWSVYDGRDYTTQQALALVVRPEGSGARWSLVELQRSASRERWHTSPMLHCRVRSVIDFEHAPTEADVDAWLAENQVPFDRVTERGATLRAGHVFTEGFRARLGFEPPHRYGRPGPPPTPFECMDLSGI